MMTFQALAYKTDAVPRLSITSRKVPPQPLCLTAAWQRAPKGPLGRPASGED